ncbi:elongation factor P hydroxylase [Agaribacterium haliotis]|uniref:elongation factor P hydroxylase n=1 Tax=Agaribacterium haliotis TaxID=2013869 RepID=UPI000BB5770E|nr:elongation factor P hydroxylase [Agaribacterium haliotis]
MSHKRKPLTEAEHLNLVVDGFNRVFLPTYRTKLKGGYDEPLYLPAKNASEYHQIQFSHDYVASALHEIAHWCVAGEKRRKQVDYGYWYAPDGRSERQQREFEQVEVKPQAIEWLLSVAAGLPFRLSVDNLNGCARASDEFRLAVAGQARSYAASGLPSRAQSLAEFYAHRFGTDEVFKPGYYCERLLR